jgi:hypothetical protein
MTQPGNRDERELSSIEDALIESILSAAPDELRKDLEEAGENPEDLLLFADQAFQQTADRCAKEKLETAKAAAAAFRDRSSSDVVPFDRERAKSRLQSLTRGDQSSPMMLAARKGEGPSEGDQDAILRALAALEEIEGDDGDE